MAEVQRSSFIPRQAAGAVPSRVRRKRRFHVFGFIATALLLASVILAVGLLFYKDYVLASLESEKAALEQERTRFDESSIASVTELDRRIAAAYYLLDEHIAPSKIFDALELTTKERVQFTSFNFERRPSGEVTVTIGGSTPEFKTVALQALQFGRNPLMEDAVFTQLGTFRPEATILRDIDNQDQLFEQESRVNFSVIGLLSQEALAFEGENFAPPVTNTEEAGEGTGMNPGSAEDTSVNDNNAGPEGQDAQTNDEALDLNVDSASVEGADVTVTTENGDVITVDGSDSSVEIETENGTVRVDENTGNDI